MVLAKLGSIDNVTVDTTEFYFCDIESLVGVGADGRKQRFSVTKSLEVLGVINEVGGNIN